MLLCVIFGQSEIITSDHKNLSSRHTSHADHTRAPRTQGVLITTPPSTSTSGYPAGPCAGGYSPTRIRLPITPTVLQQIQDFWSRKSHGDPDIIMLWAAVTLCFFGFFRSGEITVPSENAYDPKKHLTWGDISIDNPVSPSTLRIHLRQSKTDQLGRGVEIYVGKTEGVLCPVTAVTAYMASRGDKMGPFFQQKKTAIH